jgi:hypothetical protein
MTSTSDVSLGAADFLTLSAYECIGAGGTPTGAVAALSEYAERHSSSCFGKRLLQDELPSA